MTDGINTLHEFFVFTEGTIYIIIGIFLVSFVWFYKTLTSKEEKESH